MGNESMNKATFVASFPPIQSAIKIYGNNDGMRFQIDVPESEMGEAVKLIAMRGKRLIVTVEVAETEGRDYGL